MRFREFKLDELTGVKKYHNLTASQLMKKFSEDLDLPILGQGAFGAVVQSQHPDRVYKIFENDPAYEAYLEFIHNNPNIHFPKIFKIKKLTSFFRRYNIQKNKFSVIVIEKLYKVPEPKLSFTAEELANPYTELDSILWRLPHGGSNHGQLNLEEVMNRNWDGWKPGEMKSVRDAALAIRDSNVGQHTDHILDLHSGNIMQRSDGTIVIIDPVASAESISQVERLKVLKKIKSNMIKGPKYKPQVAEPDIDQTTDNNPIGTADAMIAQLPNMIRQLEMKDKLTPSEQLLLKKLKTAKADMDSNIDYDE